MLADCGSERVLKKLAGRKDVEDALSRLDMLTKEESLMILARNLEVTLHVDGVVDDVDGNVKATKMVTEHIDDNVKATMVLTEDIDDTVKATKVHIHIHDVDSNINATKVLVEDIDDNVKGIEGIARSVDNGTQHFLFVCMHIPTLFPIVSQHSRARP
jgi:hypothetical protein